MEIIINFGQETAAGTAVAVFIAVVAFAGSLALLCGPTPKDVARAKELEEADRILRERAARRRACSKAKSDSRESQRESAHQDDALSIPEAG